MGALVKPIGVEAFLAWEARQQLRHEFDGIAVRAMTGGRNAHVAIEARLVTALVNRLAGKPCRPYGSNMKIKMEHSVRYPDASVICAPMAPRDTFATQPVVVFEILSAGTADVDLGPKRAEYQATPSLQRYVVLQQTHRAAIVFSRGPGGWAESIVFGAGAVIDMPEIGIAVPLAEIYEGIVLECDLPDPD